MRRFSLSKEMISYQDKSFGNKLTYIFDLVKGLLNEKPGLTNINLVDNLKADKNIPLDEYVRNLITEYTNLNVEVLLSSGIPGAIMVFPFNRNHVFLPEMIRDNYYIKDEKKILKESVGLKGSVDLKNGKVEGIFTTYKHTLYLDLKLLLSKLNLTGAQVTAIVLHEIGHAFTYYEYANRLAQTNELLAQLAFDIHNGDNSPEKREYIFKDIGATLQLSSEEVADLYNSNDKYILSSKIYKLYVKEIGKMSKISKYDETNSEALADNFAVRQGYAKELVTALDSMYKGSPYQSDLTFALFWASELIWDFVVIPVLILSFISSGALVAGTVFMLAMIAAYIAGGSVAFKDMTYDELKQRYNRIRLGAIGALKNTDLNKDEVRDIIEQLDIIEGIVDNTKGYLPIKEHVMNVLNPFSWSINKEIQKQQNLEELGSNQLFIHSAKLRHSF